MGKGRAPCCDKSKVKKGPWSPAEDMRLVSYIKKHGHTNWRALPKHAGLFRCGKSCRLRWINYLRPDVKRGNFTSDEEQLVIKLHNSIGNKWSKIAAHLPGRTDNEIKNVWNTHIKKKLRGLVTVRPPGDSPVTISIPSSSSTSTGDLGFSETLTTVNDDDVKNHTTANISNSPASSYASNFFGIDNNNNVVMMENNAIEKIEIPFEPDVDYWELLDVLDEPGRNVGIHESNFARSHEMEEDNYEQWLRRLENDQLGLSNQVDSKSIDQSLVTMAQQVQDQSELDHGQEIAYDQWNWLAVWPPSPSRLEI